jgi:putative lipoprotein
VWAAALWLAAAAAASALASDSARLIGRTWLAEDIQGGGVIDGAQSTITFESATKVTGSGACNRLFAAVRISGGTLAFSGIGTTRKACPPAVMDQEQKFLAALSATRTFRLTEHRMQLYDADGSELVRFTDRR